MAFYVVEKDESDAPDSASADFIRGEKTQSGDAARCARCGDFISMKQWLPPFRVEIECWGRKYPDVIAEGQNMLVSARFQTLWREEGLVGLSEFHPVEIVKVRRKRKLRGELPTYLLTRVPTSRTTLDFKASGLEWEDPPQCTECYGALIKRWKRVVVDEKTWAGEDLFVARGFPGSVLASERFKQFCERHQIGNARLIPAEEYGRDFYPWEREASG